MRVQSRELLHEVMWWKSYFAQDGNRSLQMKYLSMCDSLLGISPSAEPGWQPASSLPAALWVMGGQVGLV